MAKFGEMFNGSTAKKPEAHPQRVTKWLHYTKLNDNAAQYCNEKDQKEIIALAELIDADNGVLQNVLVRKSDTDEYEIIAGHKRRRACRYLVEELGKEQYAFIPCYIQNLSDVKAEFQLYSTNSHHEKTDYEKMHELERMKYLLETYPEEFPHLQTGRMVERLATQMKLKKTTVGEYLTISKNLGEKARNAFEEGVINKTAALEMSALEKPEQEKLLAAGATSQKCIREYKEKKEPTEKAVRSFYERVKEYDTDRENLRKHLIDQYGRTHSYCSGGGVAFDCSMRGISLDDSIEITWTRLIQLFNIYIPAAKKIELKSTTIETKPEPKLEPVEKEPEIKLLDKEPQCIGQLIVTSTDMRVEVEKTQNADDVEENQENTDDKEETQYTPEYFLEEAKRKLREMYWQKNQLGAVVPVITLERQKVIVDALSEMVSRRKTDEIRSRAEKLVNR